jgi:hypothetical protein
LYVDYTQPIETLAPYFDVAIPHKNGDGMIATGQPWVCPSDRDFGALHGANYLYFPYEMMGILGSTNGVTLLYRSNPRWCLWRDSRSPHARGAAVTLSGRVANFHAVAYDGAAGWYAEVIRTY